MNKLSDYDDRFIIVALDHPKFGGNAKYLVAYVPEVLTNEDIGTCLAVEYSDEYSDDGSISVCTYRDSSIVHYRVVDLDTLLAHKDLLATHVVVLHEENIYTLADLVCVELYDEPAYRVLGIHTAHCGRVDTNNFPLTYAEQELAAFKQPVEPFKFFYKWLKATQAELS